MVRIHFVPFVRLSSNGKALGFQPKNACSNQVDRLKKMKVEKKEQLRQKINTVEERLKDGERARWTQSETEKIKDRGEGPADFFRIIYKLQMLDKMRKFLEKHGYLVRSFIAMLNHPKESWGDILIKRKGRDYIDPEKLAIRRNL